MLAAAVDLEEELFDYFAHGAFRTLGPQGVAIVAHFHEFLARVDFKRIRVPAERVEQLIGEFKRE